LTTGEFKTLDDKWQFIQFSREPENSLWLDQQRQLYVGAEPQLIDYDKVPVTALVNGRQFNLKKQGSFWFWHEREEQGKIVVFSEESNQMSTLIETPVQHFDIHQSRLIFGQLLKTNSDIYQTQSSGL